jgi:hypothetical protein
VNATAATPPEIFLASTLFEEVLAERLVAIIVVTSAGIPKHALVPLIVAAGIKLGRLG